MGRTLTTRRLRHWVRTTPNGQIGMTMLGVGALCLLVVLLIIGIDAHWM
jgi:hypothetical protein